MQHAGGAEGETAMTAPRMARPMPQILTVRRGHAQGEWKEEQSLNMIVGVENKTCLGLKASFLFRSCSPASKSKSTCSHCCPTVFTDPAVACASTLRASIELSELRGVLMGALTAADLRRRGALHPWELRRALAATLVRWHFLPQLQECLDSMNQTSLGVGFQAILIF